MPDSNRLPWFQPRETTHVSDETERKIPLRVWRDSCFLGTFLTACAVGIGYLVSLQIAKWAGESAGWPRRAWAFTVLNWPLMAILMVVLWIAFTCFLLWRFQIENATKHGPPVMGMWPPWLGMWTPWVHKRLQGREDLNQYDEIFGGGDKGP
jgi:hypothetical protein